MEEKDVQRLLDMLYGMIDEAKSVAFNSEKCAINRDEALDILDEIRGKMPLEVKKARELLEARDNFIEDAKNKARRIIEDAQTEAKGIVSESQITQTARMHSSEIIHRAEERSRELYKVANSYAEDMLRRTEEAIQSALAEVQESRVRFRTASREKMQEQQQETRQAYNMEDDQ